MRSLSLALLEVCFSPPPIPAQTYRDHSAYVQGWGGKRLLEAQILGCSQLALAFSPKTRQYSSRSTCLMSWLWNLCQFLCCIHGKGAEVGEEKGQESPSTSSIHLVWAALKLCSANWSSLRQWPTAHDSSSFSLAQHLSHNRVCGGGGLQLDKKQRGT